MVQVQESQTFLTFIELSPPVSVDHVRRHRVENRADEVASHQELRLVVYHHEAHKTRDECAHDDDDLEGCPLPIRFVISTHQQIH